MNMNYAIRQIGDVTVVLDFRGRISHWPACAARPRDETARHAPTTRNHSRYRYATSVLGIERGGAMNKFSRSCSLGKPASLIASQSCLFYFLLGFSSSR